jgi:hypothetical protein
MIPDVVAAAMAAAIQYRPPMLLVAPGQSLVVQDRHEESDCGRAGTPGRSSWSSHPNDRA